MEHDVFDSSDKPTHVNHRPQKVVRSVGNDHDVLGVEKFLSDHEPHHGGSVTRSLHDDPDPHPMERDNSAHFSSNPPELEAAKNRYMKDNPSDKSADSPDRKPTRKGADNRMSLAHTQRNPKEDY